MRYCVLVVSLALGACTSFEPLRPDMEARPIPSRLDEIAYINGLRQAYATGTSGSPVPCYSGDKLKEFRPKFVQGYRETDSDSERVSGVTCLSFKSSEDQVSTAFSRSVQDYLDNGFGLTDLYCSRFIMIAAETRQSRKIQRDTASAVDVLVGSILTALSAGTSAINLANSGFEAIDSTYKNIDAAFVITPEKESLIRLVYTAQDSFRDQARKKPPRSFAEARSFVERYASTCTFDGMRALVNGSVQLASQSLAKESKSTGTEQPPPVAEALPPETGTAMGKPAETPATDLLVPVP